MKISLLIPTRHRSEYMKRIYDNVIDKSYDLNNIEIVFYVDKDDKKSIIIAESLSKNKKLQVKFIVGERIVLSQMWNECWRIANGEIFHHAGDDILYQTNGWDVIIRNEFLKYPDRIIFTYGRDGIVDSDELGTHGFIHKNWTNTVGYFVPPYFSADYNDTWLTDLAKKINRLVYLPELFIEHLHFSVGKAELDDTYQEARRRRKKDKVRALYNSKENERVEDANKLKEFINTF